MYVFEFSPTLCKYKSYIFTDMQHKCEKCGKIHDEWPALDFIAPEHYYLLSDEDKEKYVKELSDDFCVIEYEDQTDYFIRCVLFQKVLDYCNDLQYGVWVSLSEKSFDDYNADFLSDEQNATYFGYLCNQFPDYEYTLAIRMNVVTQNNRLRPEVIPHSDQMDVPFVRDYYEGITKEEAERRIKCMMEK